MAHLLCSADGPVLNIFKWFTYSRHEPHLAISVHFWMHFLVERYEKTAISHLRGCRDIESVRVIKVKCKECNNYFFPC